MENMATTLWPLSLSKELYRPDEVASLLRVTRQTVYNWIEHGDLRAVKIVIRTLKIHRGDILKLISERP
jgi:excisionase family DNA binding protein